MKATEVNGLGFMRKTSIKKDGVVQAAHDQQRSSPSTASMRCKP
jgi:hypothetical protein